MARPGATYSGTRLAPAYFSLQAVGYVAWWASLALVPEWRVHFRPASASDLDLLAFALPDLAIVVPLSLTAALTFGRTSAWCLASAWGAAGAATYAAAYSVAWAILREGGWLGPALMVPTAALNFFFAIDVSYGHLPLFRPAARRSTAANVGTTFGYIVLFWSFFLVALPLAIAHGEQQLGIPGFHFLGQPIVATALFAGWSALGISSGVVMSRHGAGTPLPMDGTNRLVVRGPYAWVRNPMMVASTGQAFAAALWLGSWSTILYVIAGALLWHFFVRPAEERDLVERFGTEYEAYRRQVRCWVPRASGSHTATRR